MRLRTSTLLASAFLLVLSVPARAQMTPLTDFRLLEANVVNYQGMDDHAAATPPGFFVSWNEFVSALVEGVEAGSSEAAAFQNAVFFPAGLFFAGSASGSWNVIPGTHYDAASIVTWKVRTAGCLEYHLFSEVDPGDIPNSAWVEIRGPGGRVFFLDAGQVDTTGRIAAGDYTFEGKSSVATSVETLYGGTYSLQWTVTACPGTPIGTEPADVTVACNQTAMFCVVPNGPVGSFTYQWRRNYVPLANSAHYSGVNTNCLSIHNACFQDVADYDCIVTASGVGTPTRAAHLAVTPGPVGVEPSAVAWSLGQPAPNPSFASTSLRYDAPRPFFARVSIHDAAGRIVRRLKQGMLEATGLLTWDGRSDSGTPAVPGVYFLRMETDSRTEVRRLARVR